MCPDDYIKQLLSGMRETESETVAGGGVFRFSMEQRLSCQYEQLLVRELMTPTNICHQ